jgi:hypothetical protein
MSTDMLHLKQSLCDVESYYSINYIFVIFTGPLLRCRAKFFLSAFAEYIRLFSQDSGFETRATPVYSCQSFLIYFVTRYNKLAQSLNRGLKIGPGSCENNL